MATIAQIIQNNQWHSSDIRESTYVNKLFNSGVIRDGGDMAQAAINALEFDNVQSVVKTGLMDYAWHEQHLGDASDSEVAGVEIDLETVNVKTYYGNQWWTARTIQKDLMNSTNPMAVVNEFVGRYWSTQWNHIIASMVSGMSDIAAVTVGDGNHNFSSQMVDDACQKKGDMGYSKIATMYMSSTTVHDIMRKQKAANQPEVISRKYGQVTVVKDGITQLVQSTTPTLVYNGATPVIIDDTMINGVIAMVDEGAIAFTSKDLANPLMYDNSPRAGRGVGKEQWGSKALYILHPVGFTFNESSASYSKSGLTIAQLRAGGRYALAVPAKISPITFVKCKIG
jgi:hypothetical protein